MGYCPKMGLRSVKDDGKNIIILDWNFGEKTAMTRDLLYAERIYLGRFVVCVVYWQVSVLYSALTLPAPCILESCNKIKINLIFYFHISCRCLKRFYEDLKTPVTLKQQCKP